MQPIETVWEPTRVFLLQVGQFLPRLLVALVIVILGWLLAKAIRFGVVKALRAINFHVLTERADWTISLPRAAAKPTRRMCSAFSSSGW